MTDTTARSHRTNRTHRTGGSGGRPCPPRALERTTGAMLHEARRYRQGLREPALRVFDRLHGAGTEARRYRQGRVVFAPFVAIVIIALGVACEPEKVRQFEVELDVDGDGTVVSAPEGLACDGAEGVGRCDAEFDEGTRVTLQARARAGFVFFGWGEDCAPDADGGDALPDGDGALDIVDLVLDGDVECTATFVPEELIVTDESPTLSIVVVGPGSVQAAGGLESLTCGADERCAGRFPQDALVELIALPETGAELVGFSGDCEADFTGASSATVLMDRDATCTVSFFAVGDVTYPLRVLIEGNGRVTSSPGGIDCDEVEADCEARFDHGTFVTLTATADPGWTFIEWGHTCQDVGFGSVLDIELVFGLACSAVFERRLNVSVVGEGRVDSTNLEPPFSCNAGTCSLALTDEVPELTATADAGHRFVSWSGGCSGASPTILVLESATSCIANFELIPPLLTIDIVGAGSVTSTDETFVCESDGLAGVTGTCVGEVGEGGGPGIIDPGQWVCSLSFFGMGDGCDCGCGLPDPDCTSSLASACEFTSQCVSADLVVEDRNHLCYTDDVAGTPTVTLIATPADGFTFSSWQGSAGSSCTGTAQTLVLPVDDSETCTAVFVQSIGVTALRASPRVPSAPFEIAVSAQGDRVAIVGANGDEVMILDAATARPLLTYTAGINAIRMAAFDAEGARFALSRVDGVIELHVIEGPGSFVTLTGHTNAVDELAYGPTFGATIDFASGDDSGRVKLWNSTSGLVQRTLLPHTTAVNALAFVSPSIVVSVGGEGEVVTTGIDGVAVDALDVLQVGATGVASCLPLSAGGAACAVAGFDGVHPVTVNATGVISAGTVRAAGDVAFDIDLVDADTALVALADGRARLLELATGTSATLVNADASIAAGGADVSAVIVDDTVELFTTATRAHVLTSSSWTRAEILSGRRVVVGGGLDPVAFFDGAAGSGVRTFAAPGNVTHLAPSALGGGGVFASTSAGTVVRIDADDGAQTPVLTGLSPAPTAFAINGAEDRVAVAADTFNDDVIVYELPVGDPFRTFTGHVFVNDVAISGDHVLAGNGARVRVHAIATGAFVGSAQFTSGINVVAVDANANGAVAVTQQGDFMSLDVATGTAAFELDLGCAIDDVALSFDGTVAAVSCADRVVLVDISLEAPRGEIAGPFRDLRFAPDELVLLAVSVEGWTTFALDP